MKLRLILLAGCVAAATYWSAGLRAHRTVASPYTFHQDVRPILERRCGACHGDGGIAPPGLLRYEEARAQTWPLRQALISGRMPPWSGESGRADIEPAQGLTPREFDVLMTWAAGGAPEGPPAPETGRAAAADAPPPPDLVIPMPQPFTLASADASADADIAIPTAAVEGRWIRGIDLLPGTASLVRRASVVLSNRERDQVIGVWFPGDRPALIAGGGAYEVPTGASLRLHLHYQRPPSDRGGALSDHSRVAVYLADASAARQVETIEVGTAPRLIERATRAVALRPVSGPIDASVKVMIVAPDGTRTPLLTLQLRPEWPRRYVFAAPVPLARGSRIVAVVEPWRLDVWRSLTGDRTLSTSAAQNFFAVLDTIR